MQGRRLLLLDLRALEQGYGPRLCVPDQLAWSVLTI